MLLATRLLFLGSVLSCSVDVHGGLGISQQSLGFWRRLLPYLVVANHDSMFTLNHRWLRTCHLRLLKGHLELLIAERGRWILDSGDIAQLITTSLDHAIRVLLNDGSIALLIALVVDQRYLLRWLLRQFVG